MKDIYKIYNSKFKTPKPDHKCLSP